MSKTEDYINKLYDHTQDRQKQMLIDAFSTGTNAIDEQKQQTQNQTNEYLQRTDVEAQKVEQNYTPANVSDNINQQAALSLENQQKKNTATLKNQQQSADSEFERMRKLYADQFSAAIKKAQAENDMERAQMLYEQAKMKDSELQSTYANANKPANQELIDRIYDNAIESQKQDLAMTLAGRLSALEAQKQAQQQETDRNLTQTYVNALKNSKNYNEVQNAYGLGSGNMAQAQLARENALTENLTNLRKLQMGADAQIGQQEIEAKKNYADSVAGVVQSEDQQRVKELYEDALTQEKIAAEKGYAARTENNGGYTYSGTDPEPEETEDRKERDMSRYKLTNQASDTHIRIASPTGTGSIGLTFDELGKWVREGLVVEEVNDEDETITYKTVKDPGLTKVTNAAMLGVKKRTDTGVK